MPSFCGTPIMAILKKSEDLFARRNSCYGVNGDTDVIRRTAESEWGPPEPVQDSSLKRVFKETVANNMTTLYTQSWFKD